MFLFFFFFFQAEDGIRDLTVTGVQTCALPSGVVGRRWLRAAVEAPTGDPRARSGERVRHSTRPGGELPQTTRAGGAMRGEGMFKHVVRTESELRELIGSPRERAIKKDVAVLDGHCRDFMARSPFLLLA